MGPRRIALAVCRSRSWCRSLSSTSDESEPSKLFNQRWALLDSEAASSYESEPVVVQDQEDALSDATTLVPYRIRKPLRVPSHLRGVEIINDPLFNKGTSYEYGERDRLGLRGLLPPAHLTMEQQLFKVMATVRAYPDDVSKHIYLSDLLDRNSTLFYRALVRHIDELAPLIYTPTVGKACQLFGTVFRRTRGMYFSKNDIGHMSSMLANWPGKVVSVIVVTDGSRILGLGDLGCHGMAIPIGKLSLYCAAGGIAPHRVLPVVVDVGTDNKDLLADPYYLGVRSPRLRGDAYYGVIDEFLRAVNHRWPDVLVQFEDFASNVAQPLLDRYRDQYLTFNDDIQGTGATVVAGAISALRLRAGLNSPRESLAEQRIVVCGAGSAGIGCAMALCEAAVRDSPSAITLEDAARNFCVLDVNGLIARRGADDWDQLTPLQQMFGDSFAMHADMRRSMTLVDVIAHFKPTILLGLTTVSGLFDKKVIDTLVANCPSDAPPVVMPLSNPTANAECTAVQAYGWANGHIIFASGSPFDPVTLHDGRTMVPSQANNCFIFPGLGLGATLSKARVVSDSMLHAAALACADSLTAAEMVQGQVFPSIARIRQVSKAVAIAVVKAAIDDGLSREALDGVDLEAFVSSKMYYPYYVPLYQSPYE